MYVSTVQLILASGSPRRSEMLQGCGINFEKYVSNIEEIEIPGESAQQMVERLALEKGESVSKIFPEGWVLSADTTVVVSDKILGKPTDETEAFEFLSLLQGKQHEVWGAFCIMNEAQKKKVVKSYCSKVQMMPLTKTEIAAYINSREPMDKAGGYAIQGIGASLIQSVEGSYTNVVGLNLSALIHELKALGIITV